MKVFRQQRWGHVFSVSATRNSTSGRVWFLGKQWACSRKVGTMPCSKSILGWTEGSGDRKRKGRKSSLAHVPRVYSTKQKCLEDPRKEKKIQGVR